MTQKPMLDIGNTDGNAFAIIAAVKKRLRTEVSADQSDEFVEKATACHSYDELLQLTMEYVEWV